MYQHILKNTHFQIGAALALTAVLSLGWAFFTIGENAEYRSAGLVQLGTVTSKSVENIPAAGSDSEADYIIGYTFTPRGSQASAVEGKDLVARGVFNSIERGTRVDVEYLSHDPQHNRLARPRIGNVMLVVLSGVAMIGVVAGAILARHGFLKGREIAYLESHGSLHVARVIGLEDAGLRTDTDRLFLLVYEYPGPSGELIQGRSKPGTREAFRGFDLGDEIQIRVDQLNPQSSVWQLDLE